MTVGIPVWNERVSPVLDAARVLMVLEYDARSQTGQTRRFLSLPNARLDRIADFISKVGVSVLICDAVSAELLILLQQAGVDVLANHRGEPDQVLGLLAGRDRS